MVTGRSDPCRYNRVSRPPRKACEEQGVLSAGSWRLKGESLASTGTPPARNLGMFAGRTFSRSEGSQMKRKLRLSLFLGILLVPSGIPPQSLAQDIHSDDLQRMAPTQLLSVFETTKSPPLRELLVTELIKKRNEAVPILREVALKGTEQQQLLGLKLLGEMKDEKAAEIAISCLEDHNVKVQRRACTVLMNLKSSAGYKPLVRRLKQSTDTGVIKSAIAALGAIGNREAMSLLRPLLKHQNDSVRVNIAIALAQLGSQEGLEVVLTGLKSLDLQAQREATFGLGYFSGSKAREAASIIINDPTAMWKGEGHIALSRIQLQQEQRKLSFLKQLLTHSYMDVRQWALAEISELNTPEAIEFLTATAARKDRLGRMAQLKVQARGF